MMAFEGRADAGALRRIVRIDPAEPDLVHLRFQRHVGDVDRGLQQPRLVGAGLGQLAVDLGRSEEHTSELQSLMRISYAVFCLKKKKKIKNKTVPDKDPDKMTK